MSFLVDTNVLSEVRKPVPNLGVMQWFEAVDTNELFLSVLVIGEVRRGVEGVRRRDPAQASYLERWLLDLRQDFSDRILPVTMEIAEEWGRMNTPNRLPASDSLMAATAKVMGLTFVTRNTADVAQTGVALLNPFEAR